MEEKAPELYEADAHPGLPPLLPLGLLFGHTFRLKAVNF